MHQLKFIDKRENIQINVGHLPHWNQYEAVQFVTFRLADSMPQSKLKEFFEMRMKLNEEAGNKEELCAAQEDLDYKIDEWLKAGYGRCILRDVENRDIVISSLAHGDGTQYNIHAYVIMPNHLHILLSPIGDNNTTTLIGRIKQYTSRHINSKSQTQGAVWQRETFDRMIRSEADFVEKLEYIVNNPAGMGDKEYTLYVAEEIKYLLP